MNTTLAYWKSVHHNWFNNLEDTTITINYKTTVELEYHKDIDLKKIDLNHRATRIIIFDQFSRHIAREMAKENKIFPKYQYIKQAYIEARAFLNDYSPGCIDLWIVCFIFLAIRHSKEYEDVKFCVNEFHKWFPSRFLFTHDPFSVKVAQRFLRKSYQEFEQFPILSKKTHPSEISEDTTNNLLINTVISNYKDVLDSYSIKRPDHTPIVMRPKDPVVSCMNNFIRDQDLALPSMIVSLSGGVDSMVILDVLIKMSKLVSYTAMHIQYDNRPESLRESEFLQEYCAIRGVDLTVRPIKELVRSEDNRSRYETETQKIRFDLYKRTEIEMGGVNEIVSSDTRIPILLGHHKGDIEENVISNILQGRGCLDLGKMEKVSMKDGVLLGRPLLGIYKDDILDYANRNHIPYFKDSTPDWSTRGVVRRQLFPLLHSHWGENKVRQSLSVVADSSLEWYNMIQQHIINPFMEEVVYTRSGFMMKLPSHREISFWKQVMCRLFHKMSISSPSNKSILGYVEFLNRKINIEKNNKHGKHNTMGYMLKRDVYVVKDTEHLIFICGDLLKDYKEEYRVLKDNTLKYNEYIIDVRENDMSNDTPKRNIFSDRLKHFETYEIIRASYLPDKYSKALPQVRGVGKVISKKMISISISLETR